MNKHVKTVVALCLLGVTAMLGYKGYELWLSDQQQLNATDAKKTKGTITLAVDGWVGYFPLCSPEMNKRLRRQGYLLQCTDDQANYKERFERLDKGEYQFAVATVDSYLQNGERTDYSAPILAIIDESKGGDAIVARKSRITSIEDVKKLDDVKVAFTPDSPSEHLLRAVRSHFDILPKKWLSRWRVETDGSEQALKQLQSGKVDLAVLWEPDVTRALTDPEYIRLLGTENTQKLIVDVLLVNREVLQEKPELVTTFLKTFYQTLRHYRSHRNELIAELKNSLDLSGKQVEQLLAGVQWKTLTENAENWFGTSQTPNQQEYLFDTIEAALLLLQEDGVFKHSPIPNNDPYRLISSNSITDLYQSLASGGFSATIHSTSDPFNPLSDSEWNRLRAVGTFKIRPITFSSGASGLTAEGHHQIDMLVQNLQHYPNFRVEIRGHTGTRGDAEANKALSQARANEVYEYMLTRHHEDKDRLRALGYGGESPLPRQPGESLRSYNYRLPRVEIVLLSGEI